MGRLTEYIDFINRPVLNRSWINLNYVYFTPTIKAAKERVEFLKNKKNKGSSFKKKKKERDLFG